MYYFSVNENFSISFCKFFLLFLVGNKSKQTCISNFGLRLLGFVSVVYELAETVQKIREKEKHKNGNNFRI